MPIPTNKSELKDAIQVNFEKLLVDLESIHPSKVKKKELSGHAKDTLMSIHNLVSYLVGWGELVLEWHRKKSAGLQVEFPETGYRWNELGKLAQKFYKDYEKLAYPELLEKLNVTVNQINQLIDSKSNHELYKKLWYDKWTLGRMIQLNTSSPYKNARDRIRKWNKEA